jgi:serine protease AprX
VSPLIKKYRGYRPDSTRHAYSWHDAIHTNSPIYADTLLNPCGFDSKVPCDDNSHGTHTMGTMVGSDDENIIGVAPDAKWIACRNMDRGYGSLSTYIECFEWMLAPYDQEGKNPDPLMAPHVINNSWYCSGEEGCDSTNMFVLEDAVINLKSAGIVVVVSNGNSGPSCRSTSGPPGLFEPSFSIGATDSQDSIAGFSSRGPVTVKGKTYIKPNVSAPGVNVRSVIRGGNFANFSGTSMAGPHVAGTVALMISANPNLAGRVEVIESILEGTPVGIYSSQDCGDFLGTALPNITYGYGRVDALRAVKEAMSYTVNTEQNPIEDLRVFPNPVSDLITIESPSTPIVKVELFDTRGVLVHVVQNIQLTKFMTISATDLVGGLYICHVITQEGAKAVRFIKH